MVNKMKFVFFVHSIISDWNNGNAHFLRGIIYELLHRGHIVSVYEPIDSWSLNNQIISFGRITVDLFYKCFPLITVSRYRSRTVDLDAILDEADIVIVHEWNDPEIVKKIGFYRKNHSLKLFFHDTHHRSVSDPESMKKYDLTYYDGVLAFGDVIRRIYLENSWIGKAWTWHEAADIRIFKPIKSLKSQGDIIWIGNWGDNERGEELKDYLFEPVKELEINGRVYGVRYPQNALQELEKCGLKYNGWIQNYLVPKLFSSFKLTVHIPRKPYVKLLPGIPTIRPFEALACEIPLVCSYWDDCDHLFEKDKDFLMAENRKQMKECIKLILNDKKLASDIVCHGKKTIIEKHTCAHRVDQLLEIYNGLVND